MKMQFLTLYFDVAHAETTYGKYDPLYELNLAPFAMERVFRECSSLRSLQGMVDFHEADSLGQFLRLFARFTYAGSNQLLWTSSLAWIMATLGCPLFVVEAAKWLEDAVGMPPSHEGCSALKFIHLIAELQGCCYNLSAVQTDSGAGSASTADCDVAFGPSNRAIKKKTLRINPSYQNSPQVVQEKMDQALLAVSRDVEAHTAAQTLYHGCSHSNFLDVHDSDFELRGNKHGHDFGPARSSALYFGDSGRAAIQWSIRRADPPSEPETDDENPVIIGHVFVVRVPDSEMSQLNVLALQTDRDWADTKVALSKSKWSQTVQYCRGARNRPTKDECDMIQSRLDAADVVVGEMAIRAQGDGTWQPHHHSVSMRQYMLRTERAVDVFRQAHVGLLYIEIAAIDAGEQAKWAAMLELSIQ